MVLQNEVEHWVSSSSLKWYGLLWETLRSQPIGTEAPQTQSFQGTVARFLEIPSAIVNNPISFCGKYPLDSDLSGGKVWNWKPFWPKSDTPR